MEGPWPMKNKLQNLTPETPFSCQEKTPEVS